MEVLLIVPKTLPYLSGNTVTVERIAQNLRQQGHNARIATPETAAGEIATQKPDLLHFFHGVKSHISETGIPYVLTFTGTDINRDINDARKRQILRQGIEGARALTAFKREEIAMISEKLGVPVPEPIVIPQAVELPETDFRFRESLHIPADATFFLLVASIRSVKDPAYAVRELAELRKGYPKIRLVILGEVDEPTLAAEIAALGKGWVTVTKIPHAHMRNAYREADIVLNTSDSEGQSNAVLEAMSLRRPVLCADVPGNAIVPAQYRFRKAPGILAALAEKTLRDPSPPHYPHQIPDGATEAQAYIAVYRTVLGQTHG